ncbi:ABC transporter substrate-binding protein [Clostridium oryzae]|uniref:Putative ABC transporter substrate-binding protein YesO n=1 Tax=Clostridium oryzae TaxID=1450648 RepID=A0A1V4IHT7_9CLOT|nr:sugar ABC transporter substrate-binding protein [Clostridium oryzae]OPJ59496.1 putative ABC transporter substrate-binding protein YesO [Clostridium oryzae]
MVKRKRHLCKLIVLVLSAALTASVLAGCSKKAASKDGKVTLSVFTYAQPQEKKVYLKLAKEYMQKHPKVKINWNIVDGTVYATKMKALFASKKVPDIFYTGAGDLRAYVNAKELLPLDSYVKKLNIDTASIWSQALERYKYDGTKVGQGTLYALPKDISAFGFAYNKTMFKKNGIADPDPNKPYTWDEFLQICQKLTKDTNGDSKKDQWGAGFDPNYSIEPFIWTNGADFLNKDGTKVTINTPEFQEALQYFTDLTVKYKVTPSATEAKSLAYYQRWLQGQLGFFACGNWDMATFNNLKKFDYDLIPWPVSPKTNTSYTWTGSLGFSVSNTSPNKNEAVKFISYLSTDKQTSVELSDANIQLPNNVEYAKGDYIKNLKPKKNIQVMFNYLEKTGRSGPTDYTYNSEWWTEFQNALPQVLNGKQTVSDFIAKEQPKMQQKLDAANQLAKQQSQK